MLIKGAIRGILGNPASLRVNGETIGRHVQIARTASCDHVVLADRVRVAANCRISQSNVGRFTYFQFGSIATWATIGSFCSVSEYARIGATNHDIGRVTTHPITFDESFNFLQVGDESVQAFSARLQDERVTVGHDVWVGYGAVILPGVEVGNGAVIGAGAVVSHDVPPYAVVGGVPSTVIKFRFPTEVVEKIEATRWWEYSDQELRQCVPHMGTPASFFAVVNSVRGRQEALMGR